MRSEKGYLFCDYALGAVLSNQAQQMLNEIDRMGPNAILNANVDDLADSLAEKYRVPMVQLKENEITVEQQEAAIDVSHDPSRVIFDRTQPFYVKGTGVSFFVPFEGDPELFKCQPST